MGHILCKVGCFLNPLTNGTYYKQECHIRQEYVRLLPQFELPSECMHIVQRSLAIYNGFTLEVGQKLSIHTYTWVWATKGNKKTSRVYKDG